MKRKQSPSFMTDTPPLARSRARLWATVAVLAVAAVGAAIFSRQAESSRQGETAGSVGTDRLLPIAPRPNDRADPERRLVEAYQTLVAGQATQAMRMAAELVADHPEFSLAHALYGDLLGASVGMPVRTMVEWPAATDERMADLRHEATSRIAAVASRPAEGQIPAEFVALPETVRYAVAVDATRQRLYLFENGRSGLRLVRDYYVSVGRSGAGKQVEGDRRTPLGIYWITQAVTAPMRDARLGAAALKINYPNAWDRSQGRTGSGLYIHGVPIEVLSRAPLSTDGCVAMSNRDILELHRLIDVGATPVVISRRLRWLPAQAAREPHRDFLAARDAWIAARGRADSDNLSRWYAAPPVASPAAATSAPRDVIDVASQSVFAWDYDEMPLMVVTSHRAGANGQPLSIERQYWGFRQGRWRILFDAPLSPAGDGSSVGNEPERSNARAVESRRPALPQG